MMLEGASAALAGAAQDAQEIAWPSSTGVSYGQEIIGNGAGGHRIEVYRGTLQVRQSKDMAQD